MALIFLTKNFTGTSGIASAAILNPENENFQFPTLEPGFDLLSDDWFQVNVTETGKKNTTYRHREGDTESQIQRDDF